MPSDLLTLCAYTEANTPYERHFHNAHELIYILDGLVEIRIGADICRCKGGSLIFVSKLEEHSVRILSAPYRRYYIQITPGQLEALVGDPRLKSVFISRPPGFNHHFSSPPGELPALFSALIKEYTRPGPFSPEYLRALFTQIMVLCYRENQGRFPLPEKNFASAVFDAQQYIDAHFTETISVEALAKRFFLSPGYLSHAYKQWTGLSPKRYILLSRLSYAKELLLKPGYTVTQAAAACGFGDVNNFIRSFKAENGVTPAAYRRGGG